MGAPQEVISAAVIVAGGILTHGSCKYFMRKTKTYGGDLHKKGHPLLPEAIGIGAGLCFLVLLMVLHLVWVVRSNYYNHSNYYNCSILLCACTVSFNVLLGYVDDMMELGWWCKIVFPCAAAVPLVMAYEGSTFVYAPGIGAIQLGGLFYVLIVGLSVFYTNSVNILSGVNGVETGQVLVLSAGCVADRLIFTSGLGPSGAVAGLLFSCTLGVFLLNKYPAKCFVGDTFCYFAGSSLLCVGLLGGFSRRLFFMLSVQVINFIVSLPQILGVIECPRHRMPACEEVNGEILLIPSVVVLSESTKPATLSKPAKPTIITTLRHSLRAPLVSVLIRAGLAERKSGVVQAPNMTLLNLILFYFGRMGEEKLCRVLMQIQGAWCLIWLFFNWVAFSWF